MIRSPLEEGLLSSVDALVAVAEMSCSALGHDLITLMALSPQTFLLGLLCCYSNDRHCWKLHAAGGLLGILATLHLLAQRMRG